jgi:hypothetical protein
MIPHHVYYQLTILGLLWLCVMLHYVWPSQDAMSPPPPVPPVPPPLKRKRSKEPTPFMGLTQRPHCALCAHATNHLDPPPPRRPAPMAPPTRRPRAIDTSRHFCPHTGCDYQGWLGLGNLRANGHPSGGPWRQFSHSTQFSGGACHHSSKASRREDLQVEEPVTCRDFSSFNFHPTLPGMLGATLVGHQVVQMGQPA